MLKGKNMKQQITRHVVLNETHSTPFSVKWIVPVLIAMILIGISGSVHAQERWSAEIRTGAGYATQDFGDASLGAGFGFGGTIAYRFMPHLAAYAGWDWYHFASDESFAGIDLDFENTGYAFGLRFEHPLGKHSAPLIRVQMGGIYTHVEIENIDGDIVLNSRHSLGWEVGTGLIIPVGRNWKIAPGVRYRNQTVEFDELGGALKTNLRYLTAELGFSYSF